MHVDTSKHIRGRKMRSAVAIRYARGRYGTRLAFKVWFWILNGVSPDGSSLLGLNALIITILPLDHTRKTKWYP